MFDIFYSSNNIASIQCVFCNELLY